MSYINPLSKVSQTQQVNSTNTTKATKANSEETANISREDVYVKNQETSSVTYTKPVVSGNTKSESTNDISKLLDEQEARIQSFKKMVSEMIAKQGEDSNVEMFSLKLNVSKEDSLKAEDAISDGGEWGKDAVATRIMDMAESFIGSDKSLFSTIKNAVIEGYSQAEKAWGGKLPSLCQDTINEVYTRFDKLEEKLFQA